MEARSSLRSLDVLEAFRSAGRPLSLTEIAKLADMPVSTCHGVVHALERRGFLHFLSAREVYPTRRLWDLARQIDANDPIAARLEPALSALRDATAETVILGARRGEQVLYLLVIESPQTIRYSARAGEYKPLHSSAIGKVALGSMGDEELRAWLSENPIAAVTGQTITDPGRLLADISASRKRGYYVTRGENVADVMAIAAPLNFGSTQLGVAVAGPLRRMQAGKDKHVTKLRGVLDELEGIDVR